MRSHPRGHLRVTSEGRKSCRALPAFGCDWIRTRLESIRGDRASSELAILGPGRRLEASTGYRVRHAAEKPRPRQFVKAGGLRQRLTIEDAKKGNTRRIDLAPGASPSN